MTQGDLLIIANKQIKRKMSEQAISQKSQNLRQSGHAAFFTDVQEGNDNATHLRKYVNNLESKIDYAKWKQGLVLKYNYMPMKRITEKVEHERANYVKKIAEEEQSCAKMLSRKQITVQLDRFREFSKKLSEKMNEIELKISQEMLKREMLQSEVSEKKARLKAIMKENMETIKANLEHSGINTKQDIMMLVRSKSTKDKFAPTTITIDSQKNKTDKKLNETGRSTKSQSNKRELLNIRFYEECLDKLVSSIQSMKSSEDIQSGIYLDIMDRNDKNSYSTEGRYSSKSKISNTLHSKFGSNQQLRMRNQKNKANFEMEWETFKQLNWKQIMGIILVKDRNCLRTKKLLLYK